MTNFEIWITDKIPQPNEEGISREELFIQTVSTTGTETSLFYRINQIDGSGTPIGKADNAIVIPNLTLLNKSFTQVITNNGMTINLPPDLLSFLTKLLES